jgi:1,4-dihydroxy-6-naphthoate synthase
MQKRITLGFSPCPNDTFIFDALVNGLIDTGDFHFEPVLEDVETLNQWAFEGKLDVTKLSFRALLDVLDRYRILHAGSALGKGCGPLLVARRDIPRDQIAASRIAIPGTHTTANMLLSFAFPDAQKREAVLFSKIEDAVLDGTFDLGLIIHESRFTYEEKGLKKVMDLGAYWEEQTGHPIPLGGIAIRRDIPLSEQKEIDRLIRRSLDYAFKRYPELSPYITSHAQEMEPAVMRHHIELYVNDFSRDLGEAGMDAIERMRQVVNQEATPDREWMFV